MSLQAIRNLRVAGARPAGVVLLAIGPVNPSIEDDELLVKVSPGARPEFMDWRPLIGLDVAVIQTQALPDLALRAINAAEQAGAKFFGAADPNGTYPLVKDAGPEHHANLRKTWELLCK